MFFLFREILILFMPRLSLFIFFFVRKILMPSTSLFSVVFVCSFVLFSNAKESFSNIFEYVKIFFKKIKTTNIEFMRIFINPLRLFVWLAFFYTFFITLSYLYCRDLHNFLNHSIFWALIELLKPDIFMNGLKSLEIILSQR